MKKSIKPICTIIVFILVLIGCLAGSKNQPTHFTEMIISKPIFKMDNIQLDFMTTLENEKIIVIGNSIINSEVMIGQKLFVIDTISKKIIYESESSEMQYGGMLYILISKNNKFILWEKKNEYASELELFKSNFTEFIYIGKFEVILDSENTRIEDFSYPVKEIEVLELDNVIHFKFLRKVQLYYNKEISKKAEFPLIYELNTNTNKLKIL